MEEALLYFIALIFMVFATFQDLKKREVANWLNYSLLTIGLIGKCFLAIGNKDWSGLLYSLIGMAVFYGLALTFYYSRVFAGGDAKLLIGIGAILPYHSLFDLLVFGVGFIFLLFIVGAGYTLIYSGFLLFHGRKRFFKEFYRQLKNNRVILLIVWIISLVMLLFYQKLFGILLFFIPLIFLYLKSIEESCLVVLMKHNEITEGEWLLNDIKIGGKVIRSSVHGLSASEIGLIRRKRRKVWIKQGIPFVPAFLASWIIMGFVFLSVGTESQRLVSLLLEFFGVS
ncbi:MAG: A24 family peptidase [Nanoarchaeota archaeon]